MTCPRCRQDTPPGARLCPKCGASLRPSARRQRPAGIGPILSAIAKTAARLCDAHEALIYLADSATLRLVAQHGSLRTPRQLGEPFPVSRSDVVGRAVLERRLIHVRDLKAAVRTQYPDLKPRQRATGIRTMLAAPLLSEGAAIGVILIRRLRVRPFSSKQIALLEAFAEHAATAIDKTRLAQVLAEALEQQTATSEILRVISSSPTDVQPVFDAVAQSAARLCEAVDAVVYRVDGDVLRPVAHHGSVAAGPIPVVPGTAGGRSVIERRLVQVGDMQAALDEFPEGAAIALQEGTRSFISVPLLREGSAIGTIGVRRFELRPFGEHQIALLQTFADQAVIAIENVRLFKELEARNRDLTEALEQQTATAEILRAISSSPTDIRPVLETLVHAAARFCGAPNVALLNLDGGVLRGAAAAGPFGEEFIRSFGSIEAFEVPVNRGSVTGRAVSERRTVHVHDLAAAPESEFPVGRELQRRMGGRTLVATPLLREGAPIGAILLVRTEVKPFSDKQLALLRTFADQAVIAIENVRLFKELEGRNRDLTESLEQQTATSEILRVISQSQTDVQPVFDTIVRSAVRLCDGLFSALCQFDGELLHHVAHHNYTPEALEEVHRIFPMRPSRALGAPRAILERAVVHIPDMELDPEIQHQALSRAIGFRSGLFVPMLREGVPIGVIVVARAEPGPFSDNEIELLKTFADQAVIAIENVRLFKELEGRNRDLTEALEQQTATSEILRVISASPTNVQPVFDIIAERAMKLCDAEVGVVSRLDGELIQLAAIHGWTAEDTEAVRRAYPVPLNAEMVTARAIRNRAVVHIQDVLADPLYEQRALALKDAALAARYRLALGVPMVREGQVIGAIFVARATPGQFSDSQVDLLQTFADQAVIAVENVRLFKELEARNRDLTEALEQQTATSEILRVISQSQTDVQPVFDTIVRSAVRLCDGLFSALLQFDGELIRQVAQHNYTPEALEEARRIFPARPSRALGSGRAILERAVVHIPDVEVDPEYQHQRLTRVVGWRSGLFVPMLREGVPIGVIMVARAEPGPFSHNEIELLKTFADQAVIAIENVRLFKELEARNRDLTATGEILQVISRSPTDVQPVFDAIVRSAMRLLEGFSATLRRLVGEELHLAAFSTTSESGDEALKSLSRLPLADDPLFDQAVRDRAPCFASDVETDPRAGSRRREVARARGYRGMLIVPMLREDGVLGTITVTRREPGPFTDDQIALLKTFADQAVIAIENVRLFNELDARNRDLTEALEQQTATAEILRAISSSPTDIRPVLETLVHAAARFCGATNVALLNLDGGVLRGAAAAGPIREEIVRRYGSIEALDIPVTRESVSGRAVSERCTVHTHDLAAEPEGEFPVGRELQRQLGHRTVVATPLLREGAPIGAILLFRTEVKPFSDKQLELLRTFADQAVIAIENVRLFKELEGRNRDLTQALDQQTATADILSVISSSPTDVQPVFNAIVESATRLCGARVGYLFQFDGELLDLVAQHNSTPDMDEVLGRLYPMRPSRGQTSGRTILSRTVVQIPDVLTDAEYRPEVAAAGDWRSRLAVPLLRDGNPIGVIIINRTEPGFFADSHIELLKTFADQAVIAIENVRLFKELEGRNRDLTESLEQQTATSEILRVISQSQTDVQPVFETVAANALRLCDATVSAVFRFDGELIHLVALHKVTLEGAAALRDAFPMPPGRGGVTARAILTRGIVHIPDVREDPEYVLGGLAQTADYRSLLTVPMLRDGHPIGAITVAKAEPRPFPNKQIALLQTFADQAVIAIENVRLFKELEARTGELTRSVEQLTALGEIGRAVTSTLDVETVLNTIVSRASQLAGADGCVISEYDKATEEFQVRATHNLDADFVEAIRVSPLRKGEGVMGRAAEMRQPVQVPDITQPAAYQSGLRDVLIGAGYRAALSVPLLREDQIIGSLSLLRKTPGEFSPEVVELLKTFATQSALAIQNARLFREIEAKSRELEVASRHKSEFLANMSHELRTPLNAIIGYSEMVQEEAEGLGAEGLVPDLKKINSAGKHLLELINSVLDLSKIEAGKMELYLETFSVADMVRDIAGVVQPLAAKRSNRLEVRCDEGAGTMRADVTKVRQALFNLLSNACKFTERGTVSLTVGRDSTSAGEWLAFEVKDTGIGITPEQMTRLFHEFSQADAEVTRRYGGTGLGLALSRRLCRMMGGDISLESEAGRGSTFTIRLPASVAEPSAEAAAVGGAARPATGTAGTVLVIDDDATVRDLMERFLDKEGFRVVTAAGGQEGLRLAKELRPDAITLDVMMPAMDGWAVLSALKSDPELSDIPVIMLTILDARNMGYALGASDYLTKPIDRDRLAAVLKKYRRDLPVLVVDDDADLRRRLRRLLEQDGYTVAEAEHGREALARLPEISPGLILLDLMMPEMDGFEFVVELRRHEAWRAIPVIVITARDLSAEDRRRLNGYVENVLQKGAYSRDALLAEVRELVAASIARRRGAR